MSRVLVAEDEPDLRDLMALMLQGDGFDDVIVPGASDHLKKPFRAAELLGRVQLLLNQVAGAAGVVRAVARSSG